MNYKQTIKDHAQHIAAISGKVSVAGKLNATDLFMLSEMERMNTICSGQTDPGALLHTEFVRRIFGVTPGMLTVWRKGHSFPESEHGGYVASGKLLKWVYDKWKNLRDNAGDGMGAGNSPALERYRMARAEQEEMKSAEIKNEMIRTDEVMAAWYQVLSNCWEQIARFRDRLPNILYQKTPGQIRDRLITETNNAGSEILKALEELKNADSKKDEN